MISVGVDVDRLGLMVINGQPKNTSEYIQASSRVGRQAPGLVFALYNQNRSRDRSHYENFKQYHQAIYRFVEPTSVTPYSKRCRDRSLPGLIIGIARHVVDMPSPVDLSDFEQEIRIILQSYVERASEHSTSNDYGDEIEQQIQKIFNIWYRKIEEAEENNKKLDWGTIIPRGDELPLLDVFGTNIDPEAYESISLMTSMRNVDVTSTVTVV